MGTERNNASLTYDPKTGTWVASTTSNTTDTSSSNDSYDKVSEYGSGVDSASVATKEYIELVYNTLQGELLMTTTKKSIRLKVNDTVRVKGLGKYLSGYYFIASIKRTLDKDGGYSQTANLFKNGFGDSVKKSNSSSDPSSRAAEVSKVSVTLQVGDSVRIVGDNAVYSNAHDGVKVPAWVKQKTLTIDAISSDGTRVRLNPINSWTYVKFIQKV